MRGFGPIYRRQLASYFLSPIAYVTMTVFLAVSGLNFWRLLLQSIDHEMRPGDILFGSEIFWLMILVVITFITMSLVSEEKNSRTAELLLTAPVTDKAFVLGKYTAALVFFLVVCAPTCSYMAITRALCSDMTSIDYASVISGYLLVVLVGSFYVALGVFVSSLTPSQTAAAILCFSLSCLFFFCGFFRYVVHNPVFRRVVDAVAGTRHVVDFSRGIIDSRPVVMYVAGTIFFLFAAVKVVESRHWK